MRIAILAMPGVQMLDVAGPMDVFSEANKLINGRTGYELAVVGRDREPVVASNGGRLLPDRTIDESLEGFDTLLIAGSPRVQDFEADPKLVDWVKSGSVQVRRLASICTGAFCWAAQAFSTDDAQRRTGIPRQGSERCSQRSTSSRIRFSSKTEPSTPVPV